MRSSEVFHFHGRKNAISDSEGGNTLPGRKRSHPESVYSGFIDRAFPLSSVSLESPCLIKADVILALAGSNGISWSTTYLARSSDQSIVNGANLPVSVHGERSQNHQIAEIPPPSDHSAIGSGGKDVGEEGCA
ncbi:hypothetical protein BHM03_00010524 [Ensete ventricosum]|uniref:Uncharacterized protein n=1 Tax=Ensete ventricosum TaxID=4639 RepID=A0A445MD03_ENSVE|nr:hypothetical protein BHM03_00010524 [Ensete ventricosum]